MQSGPSSSPDRSDLDALYASLKSADRAIREAVIAAGRLAGTGVVERVEGGPLEWAIGMVCRLTGADRRMIVAAGETLRHLPTVSQLWEDGLISWGQVRGIVLSVRRLTLADRADVDARIAATVAAYDGADVFDPDHLVEAVDRAVAELTNPRNAERREQRAPLANHLALQQSFDGRMRGWFDYDPVNGAIVVNALDAASDAPQADRSETGQPTTRAQQHAAGLVEMAAEYLSGVNSDKARADDDPAQPPRRRRRARPLLIGHVQVSDVHRTDAGIVELNVRGRLCRITSATLDLLAADADFRAVLFDGARPLAVSRKLDARDIAQDVRLAVRARDMGDRWPGSNAPIGHTELHHFTHRANGGTHHVDELGSFTRDVHLNRIHKHGWKVSLDPDTAIVTIKRKGRIWRSLPRSVGLARPPDGRPGAHPPDRGGRRAPPNTGSTVTGATATTTDPLPF